MPKLTAKTADKHVLYQHAVQSPEAEAAFADRVYRKHYGRTAAMFREDFCGTSLISCAWVKRRPDNLACAVDHDQTVLDWGREHNIDRLPPKQAARIHQVNEDVRHVMRPRVHIIGAFNYSYFTFKEIDQLAAYFTAARKSLHREGLMVLDAYGGHEAQQVMEEESRRRGFIYVWDQAAYNPINDHTTCHIHFKFHDGSQIRRAFTYHWRLWTLGGIQDALRLAGFRRTEVYWEGTDRRGQGNGVFRLTSKTENCAGWNAYIVALP